MLLPLIAKNFEAHHDCGANKHHNTKEDNIKLHNYTSNNFEMICQSAQLRLRNILENRQYFIAVTIQNN